MSAPTQLVPLIYASPVELCCDYVEAQQCISLAGNNKGSKYNYTTKTFEIQNTIVLALNDKRYQLFEYHFHVPGYHQLCGTRYAAELHYSGFELAEDEEPVKLPNNLFPGNRNVVGLARVIEDGGDRHNLREISVPLPKQFYVYNSTYLPPNYNPVVWIVGSAPLKANVKQLAKVALPSPPLEPLNGRIVLYSK